MESRKTYDVKDERNPTSKVNCKLQYITFSKLILTTTYFPFHIFTMAPTALRTLFERNVRE